VLNRETMWIESCMERVIKKKGKNRENEEGSKRRKETYTERNRYREGKT
jgi:hypothetical protein